MSMLAKNCENLSAHDKSRYELKLNLNVRVV